MENVKDRLLVFVTHLRMSIRAFETSCELTNGYINTLKEISSPTLRKIHMHYPELRTDWLLYGEGDMLGTNDKPAAPVLQGNNNYVNHSQNVIPASALERTQEHLGVALQ